MNKAAFVQEAPPKSGKYEIVLDPAEYRINIFKEGYEEITKTFLAKPGTNNLKISLKQKSSNNMASSSFSSDNTKKNLMNNNTPKENQQSVVYQQQNLNLRPTSSKNIVVFIFDAMTNQPIANVNVQVIIQKILNINKLLKYSVFCLCLLKIYLYLSLFI